MDQVYSNNELLYFLYEGGKNFESCCNELDISLLKNYTRDKARTTIANYLERYTTPDRTGRTHPINLLDRRQIKELIELLQAEALSGKQPYSNNGPSIW